MSQSVNIFFFVVNFNEDLPLYELICGKERDAIPCESVQREWERPTVYYVIINTIFLE